MYTRCFEIYKWDYILNSGLVYGAGYLVSFNDIGGSFSGIIYGLANTIGTSTSILAPFLVGVLTTNVIFSI